MIRAEYHRFLQTLDSDTVTAEERKIANLVLQHLAELIPLSTAQGQRVKKMVLLAQENWNIISAEIQPGQEQMAEQTAPDTRLKQLSIGPFRGFAKQELFGLNSRLVLIYGPNGTGKSSFCEALEYGLLGSVAEAESKRFRNQRDYLENAHTNTFEAPVLTGVDSQGQDVPITADEALYRFCFVEKNRIDSFSRIAAQTPARQTELISTLFGLEAFTKFVRNFTPEIDERYIDLKGKKTEELSQKRQALAGFQQQLQTIPDELKKLAEEENKLASRYRDGLTFGQMASELNGDDENPGLIENLDAELQQQPIATKSNLTLTGLQSLKESTEADLTELNTQKQALTDASQQVSFKQLYEAVTQVKTSSPKHCPACQTPLAQAVVNPYSHAGEELGKLQHLGALQEEVKELNEKIRLTLAEIAKIIDTCCARLTQDNPLSTFQIPSGKAADNEWWRSLHQQIENGPTPWQHLEAQARQLEEADRTIDLLARQQTEKQEELKRLRGFDKEIVKLQTRRETADKALAKAKKAIEKFDTENAQLIADVEDEKAVVTQNQAIAKAYAGFVARLNTYKNSLPAKLVADLGETVVELYNAFNRNDAQHEQLAAVRLPLSQNQRLEISFKNDSEKFFDALHILSEGHIRCIGLAILTAKNIKESCPLLIFDDPVNAIDDEHRRAIRETLFVDDFFEKKQIIIAIHGDEFFNSAHQLIGEEAAREAESYIFSPKVGHHIQVNSLKRPKNYVLAARELLDTGEYRDSLMSARRGLESLCEQAWYHYGKHSDKSDKLISVARRAPDQPWDLRYLTENLKSKFSRSKADIPNKEKIVNSLSTVLGENAKQPPWTYLNKGTHYETDLPEFDPHTVNEIVEALEQLDTALG
ncbi:MAG TPA: chromosome segregation protein SMC [Gammaproteobacteria bacterium]|nr:chromosome segregation protein SMC [Gammaproteobacteria bacterium]